MDSENSDLNKVNDLEDSYSDEEETEGDFLGKVFEAESKTTYINKSNDGTKQRIVGIFFIVFGSILIMASFTFLYLRGYDNYVDLIMKISFSVSGFVLMFFGSIFYKKDSSSFSERKFNQLEKKIESLKRGERLSSSKDFKFNVDDNIINTLLDKLGKVKINNIGLFLEDDFLDIKRRLEDESNSLATKSMIYLFVGGISAIIGISLVLVILSQSASTANISTTDTSVYINLVMPFVSKLSAIIIIELFAYFFLKLHKDILEKVRFYQNELTNIESKIIALKTAVALENRTNLNYISQKLMETERNFIIKDSESTIETRYEEIDAKKINKLIDSNAKILQKLVSK